MGQRPRISLSLPSSPTSTSSNCSFLAPSAADVSDSTLMLASRQVRIHATHMTDIYLRVRSNPIIEHSSGVRFAPYQLTYPQSEQVGMGSRAGVSETKNLLFVQLLFHRPSDQRWACQCC